METKKDPEKRKTGNERPRHSLRDHAEKQLAHFPKSSPDLKRQTAEKLIHELQVHQIELETQAEELRRAHLKLEESRDQYLDLYDFAPLGYLTLTDKALISHANLSASVLLGIDRSKMINARFRRWVVPEDLEHWDRYFTNLLTSEEKLIATLMLKRGSEATFSARLESIRLSSSSSDGPSIRIAISDISDIRQVEDTLLVSNKKLNLLSSITRHDINNQLVTINGYLELLHGKGPVEPEREDFFNKITNASARIDAMIQFTREYEKIGVNAPVWQDCRTLVNNAVKQTPLGHIKVKNELPAGTEVFADPMMVKVCYNLMDNAVKYGGTITTIRFSAQQHNGDHIVVCEDDGDGILAEDKERIFNRGFGKNTGFGLTLAREILDITGINIKETGKPGDGARFEMTVPEGKWRIVRNDA